MWGAARAAAPRAWTMARPAPSPPDARDAGAGVGGLQALDEAARGVAVERGAQIDQALDGFGRGARSGRRVASASTRPAPAATVSAACSSALSSAVQGGGDAALRPGGGGGLAHGRGRRHQHRARRGGQGGGQARQPCAHDQRAVVVEAPGAHDASPRKRPEVVRAADRPSPV